MDESLSVENQILLCCARRDCDPDAVGALVDLGARVQRRVDWDALLAAARLHGLLPLLYERLAEVGGDRIPPDVIAHLRGAYYANLLRNQRLGAELAEVIGALRPEGVEAIVLKGGALAWTVYANPAQRPMADLDLLVRPEEMDCAGTVLGSLGFRLPASYPVHLVPFQQRFGSGLEWQRSREGRMTRLDVHHHLAGIHLFRDVFPVEFGALWAPARPLAVDGREAWQLSAEDTLIHLCLHLARPHIYDCPLLGYVDIDRVVAAPEGGPSWRLLVERAGQFQAKTVVYYGLRCAQSLLGTPLPSGMLDALQPGGLHLQILHSLAPLDPEVLLYEASRPRGVVERVLLHAALADGIQAAGAMVRGLLFPGEEWLVARYDLESRDQAWRYHLAHPVRIARSFLRDSQRRLVGGILD
jgi:hypothetical protein